MSRRRAPHVTITLLFVLTASSAMAALGRDIDAKDREAILQHAYGNLTRYAAVGGENIAFRIDGLRTVKAEEFAGVPWLRLMTMPGGDMIDVVREVREYQGTVEAVIYRPKWNLDAPDYLQSGEGISLRDMTVAEVLQAVAAETPEAGRVTAITSYQVAVEFQGRSRTYRAAVLWLPPSPGRDATLFFLDHITQGLEEAVRERPIRPRPRPPLLLEKNQSCYASTHTAGFAHRLDGYDGHWDTSTSHFSSAGVSLVCNCETNCTAKCDVELLDPRCDDSATFTVDACHKMATSLKVQPDLSGDGVARPPVCAAGVGCVKRSCIFCLCGISIEVEFLGTKVSFASGGQPDWDGNLAFPDLDCPPCTRVEEGGGGDEEDYQPDEDDWGDTGGGSTGGGVISTRSPNGSGGYTCCYYVRNPDGSRGSLIGCNPC